MDTESWDDTPIVCQYDEGTIRLDGNRDAIRAIEARMDESFPDHIDLEYDQRSDSYRFPAHCYAYFRAAVQGGFVRIDDSVFQSDRDVPSLESSYDLRVYQQNALDRWLETDVFRTVTDSPSVSDVTASTKESDAGEVNQTVSEARFDDDSIDDGNSIDDGETVGETDLTGVVNRRHSKSAADPPSTSSSQSLQAPRGILELPTGSGKTVIGIAAIERLSLPTLVVVPTIDLLDQWREELDDQFDVPIGQYGGGEQRHESITVSTYDSAYLRAAEIGDRFELVIFDEVHHLGGERYRDIGHLLAAPARLGLTATLERADGAHDVIETLVGPLCQRIHVDELTGDYLAQYDIERLTVPLTAEERAAYDHNQEIFIDYLVQSNLTFRHGSDYQELVKRSGSDPAARKALLARERARKIMLGSEAKLDALESILSDHRDDRCIIFTAHNDLVYTVSERFLVPAITHRTAVAERREILDRFRRGSYTRVVTSNVLDEGVDVPDASVAVVLSGSASEREFTQRLGRILRPKEDDGRATLYEVVSEQTSEERVADRRR